MKVEKPWGNYKQYALNRSCSVRILNLLPNQETSLHWHNLRSDLWVILDEGIEVQIGEDIHMADAGEEYFVPSEQVHRLKVIGDKPVRIMEIAFGYCLEDDIHRLADDYGREVGT